MGGEGMTNPMAMVDSAMRQWQTAVQQMMETRGGDGCRVGTKTTSALRSGAAPRAKQSARRSANRVRILAELGGCAAVHA